MTENNNQAKMDNNLQREAGISALRSIRRMVDADSVLQKRHKKTALVLATLFAIALCCVFYLVFAHESEYEIISSSHSLMTFTTADNTHL